VRPDFMKLALLEKEWLVDIRRDIHSHPETGFELARTSALVESVLDGLGVSHRRAAVTGVVGRLSGAQSGPVVGFRADMDAIEAADEKSVPYASSVAGKVHACGHDAHTAMLLGAAKILSRLREDIPGEVRFFFEPAEETVGGALPMIKEGAMEDPDVDAVFGLHVAPGYPTGSIGLSFGKLYASSDMFDIEIAGRGSHGAAPHLGVDALAAGCQVVSVLQQITSREADPLDPLVVTVGTFRAGSQRNVIASKAEMEGIIRTLDPAARLWARKRVREVAEGVASALGAKASLRITEGYPCLVNDAGLAAFVQSAAVGLLGQGCVHIMEKPTMAVDDFAYFIEKRPGVMFMLGTGNARKKTCFPLHSGMFDIDEDCLPIGTALLAKIAYDFVRSATREEA